MQPTFAMIVDLLHAAAMVIWGVGLPLLFWHRWPRLTKVYLWYVLCFVGISQASHFFLDECLLTYWARELRSAADLGAPSHEIFTVRFVNFIAGIRPSARSAVVLWEVAMVVSALGVLWSTHHTLRRHRSERRRSEVLSASGKLPRSARAR